MTPVFSYKSKLIYFTFKLLRSSSQNFTLKQLQLPANWYVLPVVKTKLKCIFFIFFKTNYKTIFFSIMYDYKAIWSSKLTKKRKPNRKQPNLPERNK